MMMEDLDDDHRRPLVKHRVQQEGSIYFQWQDSAFHFDVLPDYESIDHSGLALISRVSSTKASDDTQTIRDTIGHSSATHIERHLRHGVRTSTQRTTGLSSTNGLDSGIHSTRNAISSTSIDSSPRFTII